MIFTRRFLIFLILCGLISACSVLDAPTAEPLPISTATEPPVQTPTRVWFPPSATSAAQAFATYTATPEMRPGLGNTSLRDSFTDADVWDTAASDQGSANVDNNRLSLAAGSKMYIVSLRRYLDVSKFYVEVTARLSLCRGEDTYGILVRANAVAYYRFALSCDGMVSAERVRYNNRQVLQEPIASGDAPPGAPGEVRIGVWAVGTELRLFLNGRFQFAVNDPSYSNGTVGFFARSAGDTPVTVNFTDLILQEVSFDLPTRTPLP
jgi:hypothetical protein